MSGPRPKLPIKNLGLLAALAWSGGSSPPAPIPMWPKGEKIRNEQSGRGDEKRARRLAMIAALKANPMNDGRISNRVAVGLYRRSPEARVNLAHQHLAALTEFSGGGPFAVGYLARGGR